MVDAIPDIPLPGGGGEAPNSGKYDGGGVQGAFAWQYPHNIALNYVGPKVNNIRERTELFS